MNWNSIKLALPLLLAVACAKEHPGNPGSVPEEGAVITVSLPYSGTKTALGEKAGNLYPVLWKEGDCLSLNGASSMPLSAEDAGATSAGFVFRDGLSTPYNLLYPLSGEKDLVVFPGTQVYVPGSFDPAAVPMWGTSSTYTNVALRHFFSVVRVSIKTASARVLRSITLTALGGESISGTFRAGVDENGAFDGRLVAENGSPSLVYSFGEEGLSLNAGETAVAYISIPLGSYAEGFKAVIRTADQEYRQLRFFSAGRTVAPGKVLEFPEKDFEDCSVVWEYFVSATGTGNGKSEDEPMSIDSMLALLQENSGDTLKDATFHFTAGTHNIASPITLPGKDYYSNPVAYTITGDNQAILNGSGTSQIFVITSDNSHVTIKDMTLTNGSATASGGLVSVQENGPLFEHCSFTNTASSATGGAVRISDEDKGKGRFSNCTFSDNTGSSGGAVVITNPKTQSLFSECTFARNTASGSGGALYSTNGTLTLENCTLDGNTAKNGGAICSTSGTIHINGGIISNNTASSEGGAFYCGNKEKPVYYINGCSIIDNTGMQNGYAIYLNTSAAPNFATLCMNNTTLYNSKPMETSNASAICNKGKSLIINSTFYGTTSKWGTFALGCHKAFEDQTGCLLLNSIFINTTAGKPAIYQTGSNYYAIAKNCLASAVVSNSQFTQKNVVIEPPTMNWNGTLFTWSGNTSLPHWSRLDTETELSGDTYALASGFLAWLKSLKYNIDGTEYDALDVDQTGHLRSEYSWAGAYQK